MSEPACERLRAEIARRKACPSVAEIQRAVAAYHGMTVDRLLARNRHADVIFARQQAMYLARRLTWRSYSDIAKRFGGFDHTTVLHAVQRTSIRRETDAETRHALEAIEAAIGKSKAQGVGL